MRSGTRLSTPLKRRWSASAIKLESTTESSRERALSMGQKSMCNFSMPLTGSSSAALFSATLTSPFVSICSIGVMSSMNMLMKQLNRIKIKIYIKKIKRSNSNNRKVTKKTKRTKRKSKIKIRKQHHKHLNSINKQRQSLYGKKES